MNLLLLLVSGIFVHNFILSRFLGICPFLGVSKQIETAFGMGIAVTFVIHQVALEKSEHSLYPKACIWICRRSRTLKPIG